MPGVKIRAFDDVLERTSGVARHLLLGNGFSIDYDRRFSYGALAHVAASLPGTPITPELRAATDGVADFETLARYLTLAARLTDLYGKDEHELVSTLERTAERVRLALVDTIMSVMPESGDRLETAEIRSARAFLAKFTSVYTLNYDLLLYWVAVKRSGNYGPCPAMDGFRGTEDLRWGRENPAEIFYLHGALHLFDEDGDVRKVKHQKGRRLAEQIADHIREGSYPLVVTEGTSLRKQVRIKESRYLRHAHKRLARVQGALFVHGASMDDKDAHVFDRIASANSQVSALYVGLHGDEDDGINRDTVKAARALQRTRAQTKHPLKLGFYDTRSAHVWR